MNHEFQEKLKRIKVKTVEEILKESNIAQGLRDYIQLPQGKEIILVSKYRLGFGQGLDDQIQAAATSLGLTLSNTAQEQNGRGYIGSITWFDALKLNLELNGFTLNLRQFEDLLALLDSNKDIYDGAGSKIQELERKNIYNEITEQRDFLRAEWLDADFKTKGQSKNKLIIKYNHKLENGILVPKSIEDLVWPIKEKCYVDLSFNTQGMPTTESRTQSSQQGKNIFHFHPRANNNSVARFSAYSGGAILSCYGPPDYSDVSLGVRHAFFHRK